MMATRNKRTNYTVIDPDTLLLAGDEKEGEESIEAKILGEFNQSSKENDWTVTVEKFVKYGEPFERVFQVGLDELKGIPERLSSEWGPGMYVVSVRCNGIMRHRFRYAIAAPKV